jgi:predicted lipoprotein with Yx(FWY)xxD motif
LLAGALLGVLLFGCGDPYQPIAQPDRVLPSSSASTTSTTAATTTAPTSLGTIKIGGNTPLPTRLGRVGTVEHSTGADGQAGAAAPEGPIGDVAGEEGEPVGTGEAGDPSHDREPTVESTTSTTAPGTVKVTARTADYGTIVVDGEDHALYAWAADQTNIGACAGECTAVWVPVRGDLVLVADGIDAHLVGSVTRPDGIVQLSYGGRPLYQLRNEPAGTLMGQGDGGAWFAVAAGGGLLGP